MENKHQSSKTGSKSDECLLCIRTACKVQGFQREAWTYSKVFEWIFVEEERKVCQILLFVKRRLARNSFSNQRTNCSSASLEKGLLKHSCDWVRSQKAHYCNVFSLKRKGWLRRLCESQREECGRLDEWSVRNDEAFNQTWTGQISERLCEIKKNRLDMQTSRAMCVKWIASLVDNIMRRSN